MQATLTTDSRAPPGTAQYLSGLIAHARTTHPDLPIEPVILQSLLLCLIAQPRLPCGSARPDRNHVGLHLILRTKEEDIGLVANLVSLHIVGIQTHKHKVAPKPLTSPITQARSSKNGNAPCAILQHAEDPDAFLRCLFFRRGPCSSHRSGTPRLRSGGSTDNTPRLAPTSLGGGPGKNSKSNISHVPHRSASFPAPSTDGEDEDKYFDASSLASSRRPLLSGQTPASTMRSRASKNRPGAHRLRTDPLPLSALFTPPGETNEDEQEDVGQPSVTSSDSIRMQRHSAGNEKTNDSGSTSAALPKAVVVTGLEHTNAPAQRALMRVLAERRIAFDSSEHDDSDFSERDLDVEDGVWNLPDGFVMVYVCKSDPHERPAILKGLVDRFSMSADVSLQPSVRQSYLAYRATHTPTPRGTPIPSPLALPHTAHPYFAAPAPAHHSPARRPAPLPAPTPQAPPALSASELSYLRTLARANPVAAPIFYPSVHATIHMSSIQHPPPRPEPCAALHPSLDMYMLDLFAATRHHPALDGTLLTMRAHADAEALARAYRVLNGDTVGAALVYHEARLSDRETAAGSTDGRSWADGSSAAWRSAESLGRNGHANGHATKGAAEEFGLGDTHGVRLRVDDMDGGSHRSFSNGFEELFDGSEAEMSPAEALDTMIARVWPEEWDVSEEDVARIFPRVVSHRLRVRDGPDDEVLGSVMWPAVPLDQSPGSNSQVHGQDDVRMGWERKSVKDILVRILADV